MLDLTPHRARPHLSASSVGDYIDCGLLYRFGRVDKIKPEFKSSVRLMSPISSKKQVPLVQV
jgi:putative RecB family exonuclease